MKRQCRKSFKKMTLEFQQSRDRGAQNNLFLAPRNKIYDFCHPFYWFRKGGIVDQGERRKEREFADSDTIAIVRPEFVFLLTKVQLFLFLPFERVGRTSLSRVEGVFAR